MGRHTQIVGAAEAVETAEAGGLWPYVSPKHTPADRKKYSTAAAAETGMPNSSP